MGICSTNRLSFIGAEPEYDLRPGSRFSGLSGLVEYCDILCERALLDDQISSILEAKGDENEENQGNEAADTEKKDTDSSTTKGDDNKEGKISALFNKLMEAIKKMIANVKTKFLELLNKDVDLVVRFQKYLQDPKNLEGFTGVENIQAKYLTLIDNELVDIGIGNNVAEIYTKYVDQISSEKDQAKIDELKKNFEEEVGKLKSTENNKDDNKEDSQEDKNIANKYGSFAENGFVPSQDTLNKIANALKNSKTVISTIDSIEKAAKTNFDSIQREYKLKAKNGGEDVIENYRNKILYEISVKAGNMAASTISNAMKETISYFNTIRKIWVVCGKYASLKGGKK